MSELILAPNYDFDMDRGVLLKDPLEQREAVEAGSTVIRIGELITSESVELTAESYEKGEFRHWTNEDYLQFGRQALRIVQPYEPHRRGRPPKASLPLTERHAQRLYFAGLGPERRTYAARKRFGSFAEFQRQIGSPVNIPNGFFDDWTIDDFTDYARSIHRSTGRRPRMQDFDDFARASKSRRLPGYQVIQERYGGIAFINERLGFPDYAKWAKDEYIDWALRVIRANPDKKLNIPLVDELSKRQRGPSVSKIIRTFDQWARFLLDVERAERLQAASEAVADQAVNDLVTNFVPHQETAPQEFPDYSEQDKETYVCMFTLVKKITARDSTARTVSQRFVKERNHTPILHRVRQSIPDISQADIEVTAMELGVFDRLWPDDEDVAYLAA